MRDQQRGYAAGLGWVGLTIVSLATLGRPPGPTAADSDITAFFTDHRAGIVVGSTTSAVAALLMGTFIVSLSRRFTAEWPAHLARLAGAVLVGAGLAGGVLQACLAQSAPHLPPTGIVTAWTIVFPVFYLMPPLALSWVLGCAAFALRGSGAADWVASLAGIVALLAFVAGVAELLWTSSTLSAAAFLGLPLTMVWVVATSVSLWRSESAPGPSSMVAATTA